MPVGPRHVSPARSHDDATRQIGGTVGIAGPAVAQAAPVQADSYLNGYLDGYIDAQLDSRADSEQEPTRRHDAEPVAEGIAMSSFADDRAQGGARRYGGEPDTAEIDTAEKDTAAIATPVVGFDVPSGVPAGVGPGVAGDPGDPGGPGEAGELGSVLAAVRRLDELARLPLSAHPDVFAEIHEALHSALAEIQS